MAMNEDKCYSKLLKNLSMEKCPDGFTEQVIEKSGILVGKKSRALYKCRGGSLSWFYGIACVATVVLIAAMFNFNARNLRQPDPDRLAINTVTLAGQVADGIKVVFTGTVEKRSGVK